MATDGAKPERTRPLDVRVAVKPVFASLVHSSAYEGPCRTGRVEDWSPDAERVRAKEGLKRFAADLEHLSPQAKILSPALVEHGDDWLIEENQFRELEADGQEADLYLVGGCSLNQFVAVEIGERYRKPVVMMGGELSLEVPMGCDAASHLRAKRLEGYVALDYDELNHLIALLQVRKAIHQTKLLRVTEGKFDNVNGNYRSLERFKAGLGVDHQDISIAEFVKEMDRIADSHDHQREAEDLADRLIQGAQQVHIERQYVINDVRFYLATRNLMARYGCNAFTTNCFELCPDRRAAYASKTIPCLTHSLLKDQGIPSACEGDVNALLTVMLLTYIAKRTAYMGNIFLVDRRENTMKILHDVAGLKMQGFDKPDLPYEMRNFTVGGWGSTIRYDFSRDSGQEVTVARFNPLANNILVTTGKITGGGGFDSIGCSLEVVIQLPDVLDFFHKAPDFGNHCGMVYGDYTEEIKAVGRLMGFEVTEAM